MQYFLKYYFFNFLFRFCLSIFCSPVANFAQKSLDQLGRIEWFWIRYDLQYNSQLWQLKVQSRFLFELILISNYLNLLPNTYHTVAISEKLATKGTIGDPGRFLKEHADRTPISQAVNSCVKVCLAGNFFTLDSRAWRTLLKKWDFSYSSALSCKSGDESSG
mgnify:CR=1 FL=1